MNLTHPLSDPAPGPNSGPRSTPRVPAATLQHHPPNLSPSSAPPASPFPLVLENVTYVVERRTILKNVSLSIGNGEIYVVMGLSGSGKTTLLRLMIGLGRPTTGRVLLLGHSIADCNEESLNRLRMSMGMVFQYSALFDSLTVWENVAFPLRQHSRLSKEEIAQAVRRKLALVGMSDTEKLFPDQLSGGMRKRVSIARALASDPQVILYDEPTSGLDSLHAARINNLIMQLRDTLGVTSVVVTHDPRVAHMMADRVAVIHEGNTLAQGTLQQVCNYDDEMVQQLLHCYPEGPAAQDTERHQPLTH